MQAMFLKPEWNKSDLELKMAEKNIPYLEQSFLYCFDGFGVKDRIAMTYTKPNAVVVIPPGNKTLWVRYETAARSYALTTGERNAEAKIDFNFETGQSYVVSALWHEDRFIIITLNEVGIEDYNRREWEGNSTQIQRGFGFENFEEYNHYEIQRWQVRMEETRKQL
jgi:hypothetical protein